MFVTLLLLPVQDTVANDNLALHIMSFSFVYNFFFMSNEGLFNFLFKRVAPLIVLRYEYFCFAVFTVDFIVVNLIFMASHSIRFSAK